MKLALFIGVLVANVSAWWEVGHLLTARRARDLLAEQNPEALKKAEQMLVPLKRHYPQLTYKEKYHPFVECATFADEIMALGYMGQYTWHFRDTPIVDEENKTLADFPEFELPPTNNVEALGNLTNFLTDTGDYKDSLYYKQIVEWFPTLQDQKSFALRLIIHYCGDIHQPLHTVAVVNSTYPKGDEGGNRELIPDIGGVINLHYVWDSVSYQYVGYADLPMNETMWNYYGE